MFTNAEIIAPTTLRLLQELMVDEQLKIFYLVGGTALALQIGHRYSIDLDLFTSQPFNTEELQYYLSTNYNFKTDLLATNTLKGFIQNVKCDFITHSYFMVSNLHFENGVRIISLRDIAAMKLSAIAQNGSRYKDFIDIFYLLKYLSLNEMLEAFKLKYPLSSVLIAVKGLSYFEDINFDFDKPVVLEKISFTKIKNRILNAIQHPDKIYS
ncbi:MAG: nucleotidyl transferase AbiEii/AbiGii toxin family protein [Bacteroidetes bacterium]|nr:nucleotidyl transferase AbiEii/AbiGii toxin family protein [Bacteroidota bacterium]MBS1591914.1 nucleotidyl transferase AbiEii/AbiGii toxin family protein [Bacteroidota bacterium]